jgi:hypothetical protein
MKTAADLSAETQQAILREAETFDRGEELLTKARAVARKIQQRADNVLAPEKVRLSRRNTRQNPSH